MSSIHTLSRPFAILMGLLFSFGLWQIGEGSWIYAKARLAQLLLQRAWNRALAGEVAPKPWPWADTWPVARLIVPGQHVDLIVLEGAYGRTLAFGPASVESGAQPGTQGTAIITGHRDTHFAFLKHVESGERIGLQSADGHFHLYRVTDSRIVDSRRAVIPLTRSESALVLVTCYPFQTPIPGGPLRYVVTADLERIGEKRGQEHKAESRTSGWPSSQFSISMAAPD